MIKTETILHLWDPAEGKFAYNDMGHVRHSDRPRKSGIVANEDQVTLDKRKNSLIKSADRRVAYRTQYASPGQVDPKHMVIRDREVQQIEGLVVVKHTTTIELVENLSI